MAYLSTDLITSVKRRCAVPTSQVTFEETDFLAMADEEIRSKIVPLVLRTIEEYYTRTFDTLLVANQAFYPMPTRAIAGALRNVQLVDVNDDMNRRELERLSPEDLYSSYTGDYRFTIQKNGFYLQSNQIVIYPTPTQGVNLLRQTYSCRPNSLVDPSECAQVQSIDFTTNQITVVSLPTNFSTLTPLDFIQANPGFDWTAQDQTPTNVSGNVLTFGSALPSNLSVGDYICLSGYSCVVQVPVELHPLLYQYVVVRVLSAQTDSEALQAANFELQQLQANALSLISPRVVGKPKRATNGRAICRWI